MAAPSAAQVDSLREFYHKAHQGHVFHYWDILDEDQKTRLYSQLSRIDPNYINTLYSRALDAQLTSPISPGASGAVDPKETLAPPPSDVLTPENSERWSKIGLEAIGSGKVAVLLLAGGQGTRLGSSSPKGCYNINLPSQKTLFQLQAERIIRLGELSGLHGRIRWYIMTSGPTRQETEQFFQDGNWFGVGRENIVFFEQGTLPCISNEGKILLASASEVAVAPDGNGGIYTALNAPLVQSKLANGNGNGAHSPATILSDMRAHGVEHIHTYCVDNALVKPADPIFMGFSIEKGADCGSKVVIKENAKESVGVLALRGGKWMVVEYSEIPEDVSAEADDTDPSKLKYRAANIVNHYYSLSFLETVETLVSRMSPHIAHKKIASVAITPEPVTDPKLKPEPITPTKPNGIKLEFFIFDVLPHLRPEQHALLEVERQNEFSPLKNGPGTAVDNPTTSRQAVLDLHRRWLEGVGATLVGDVEVSPKASYGGENLEHLKDSQVKGIVEAKGA